MDNLEQSKVDDTSSSLLSSTALPPCSTTENTSSSCKKICPHVASSAPIRCHILYPTTPTSSSSRLSSDSISNNSGSSSIISSSSISTTDLSITTNNSTSTSIISPENSIINTTINTDPSTSPIIHTSNKDLSALCSCGRQHLMYGETYLYCTCGKGPEQPFCNKIACQNSPFQPLPFTVTKRQTYYLLCPW